MSGGVLTVAGGAGETNNVTVGPNAGGLTYRVTDLGANVSPGLFCLHVTGDAHSVDCGNLGLLIASIAVTLGDGNDRVSVSGAIISTLSGGSGNDTLTGGTGVDTVHGGSGADTIAVRDGKTDQVDCGSEIDTVVADLQDTVAPDCEIVDRATSTGGGNDGGSGGGGSGGGTGGGAGGGTPGSALAGLTVATGVAKVSPSGTFPVAVRCRGKARCRGTLVAYTVKRISVPKKARSSKAKGKTRKAKGRRIRLAKRKVSIRGDRAQSLTVRLSKANRRLFRRLRMKRVRAKVTVYYTTTAGLKGKAQRTLTLSLRKR
jgi:hypothetical protein